MVKSGQRTIALVTGAGSPTGIGFAIARALGHAGHRIAITSMTARIEAEGAGYDLASHRASPPGIRIWAGATIERSDVEALLPWLDWAWEQERGAAKAA